ncbi:AMP-binding protein [Psychromarinibacter sp. C21-152]|uniref:AMP-binding protein n=1 Tax=Psychromarinibacter sediminicola TaxID=3033385 RepID=A0AAE3NXS5_9RHOB|nr:AMP-binding protein [Psychromarinibacter sediminicola]MDF0602910.1 AMP-binding protein [Psychromarinibacter sediminicola]
MRAGFRWSVPARFNMGEACCDSWARADPTREAVVHLRGDGAVERWSYADLKRASDGLAASFRARGVGRGDRVGVFLAQAPEVLIAHLACYKLGAVALPLFALFGPDALAYRLGDSGARAVVTDADGLEKVMDLAPGLPELAAVYAVGGGAAPVRDFHGEIAAAGAFEPVETAADDPAVLIYTSGTTGDPKGVLHAHRFLLGHLPSMEANHEGFPKPGDRGWTPADWAWIGGLMDMAMPCLYYGRPQLSHRMRKFDPDYAYRLIREHGLTTLFLPPTALKLMRQADVPGGLAVRSVSSGGEALGADLLDWGRSALGAPINELYGQTECNLVIASCHGSMAVRPGAMGFPLPGFEVALLDGDTVLEGPGEGEIAVRRGTPGMFLRYWNKPEATAAKFAGDWMRTGDLGRRDADGYYWFASRDDDVITSAGYRIGPSEIETCLVGHADVVNAAVVGVPDPVRTEAVKAFVVLRDGVAWSDALAAALVARVRERVSAHVAPRQIEPIAELPMTATGKVMRRALRERGAG